MATTYNGVAVAGLLRYRHRKEETKRIASRQQSLPFAVIGEGEVPQPKLRRQGLHTSDGCGLQHLIPWNKSFDVQSCVYRAGSELGIQSDWEELPNACEDFGTIEAI